MGMFDRYLGVRIVTAEPENLLSKLSSASIELWDVRFLDFLTVEFKIQKWQLPRLEAVLKRTGGTYTVVKREGILWWGHRLVKRPVLILGVFLFLFCAILLPNRVYFVEVSGNESIPDKRIISQAEKCGIRFGAKASEIRSEEIKNQLLGSIPELQWVGVTTSGSTAVIQVTERSKQDENAEQKSMVASIVASRDGVITQMTVERGTQLFFVGQSVQEDDVLVSGYTDCGLKIVAESADAEVFAHTLRENRFIIPTGTVKRGSLVEKTTCYRLRIGKKVIKLCNHSGISDGTCVKMYSENYWTLPGGFQLPISLIKVDHFSFEQTKRKDLSEASCQWLLQFARSYLQEQMIAGTILEEELQWEILDDACVLTGIYACNEMIGQVKYEEIIRQNAEDN